MAGEAMTDYPYEYRTRTNVNLRIMTAISEILFWERMEILMPLVAEKLAKAGVRFDGRENDAV